jgi:hypothetical protein
VKWAAHRPSVCVTNQQDRNRRTFGEIRCRYKAESGKNTTADEETAQLVERVKASPALSSWLRAVALDLNKLGRWSWGHISDDQVFDPLDNPVSNYYFNRRTEKKEGHG